MSSAYMVKELSARHVLHDLSWVLALACELHVLIRLFEGLMRPFEPYKPLEDLIRLLRAL